jgi:hypothetical protein
MYTTARRIGEAANRVKSFVFSKQQVAPKSDHHFIDFIRFISIIGIVSIHSMFLPKNVSLNDFLHQVGSPTIYVSFISFLRFSVISFCLISGYLLAPKITNDNKFKFYINRIKAIAKPSIIAILITAIVIYVKEIATGEQSTIMSVINSIVFEGVFWFIPMQVLSLLILMLFITSSKQLWVGITLFTTLIGITLYYVYIKKLSHVDPVFSLGFVFYFWLGTMFYKWKIIEKIKKTSLPLLICAWVFAFAALNMETILLWKYDYPHLLNNLRVSNQVYGVISFFVLVKISDYFRSFSFLNPRKESFGIYLYHRVIGLGLFFILHRLFDSGINYTAFTSIIFTLAHFIFTYVITTVLVKQLIKWEMFFLTKGTQYPNTNRILLSLRNSSNIIL